MKDFLMVQAESLDEVIYNAMILFKNSDLGGKIETSLNRELKKDVDRPPADTPLQLRLRLHNRFNMDLNNVYALELFDDGGQHRLEASVNVYHDDFQLEDFTSLLLDVFGTELNGVTFPFLLDRLTFNYRNTLRTWQAAKEKQFIKDPQVDRLKEMFDAYAAYTDTAREQLTALAEQSIAGMLTFNADILLEGRRITLAKSKILKVQHNVSEADFARLTSAPQLMGILLAEYCLVPLFLCNELYIMSLIYKRNLEDIRTVLRKRVREV